MATAYASVASATGTDDITITKPSGLADGDMMVAILGQGANVSTGFSLSGWTSLHTVDYGTEYLTILAKVADSADAAASDFTFVTANNNTDIGAIIRITGTAFSSATNNINSVTDTEDTDLTPAYTPGITPKGASSVLIMGTLTEGDATLSFGSYAIATDDPSWTERVDLDVAGDGDLGLAIATAVRTETTDTGNFSLTVTSGGIATSIGFILSVIENTNGSVTLDLATLTASPKDPVMTGTAVVTLDLATLTASPKDPTVAGGTAKWITTDKTGTSSFVNRKKT